ncbi:MAG TPA: hypothetical protein VET88_00680, partial [Gammaproteobacteria bacterium]|nr:hypothetical protein [Gammaproteobacteria bacterium]
MKVLPYILWLLAVLFLPASAAAPQQTATPAAVAGIDAAIARGTAWLARYPASPDDGGLADMLDEGVNYHVRRNLTRDAAERARLDTQLRAHMTRLADLPEYTQWVYRGRKTLTDYYHLVLAAHLLRDADDTAGLRAEITKQAAGVLRRVPYCDPTKRLTIAVFLQYLGTDPGVSLPRVLAASRIERIAQGRVPHLPPPGASPEQRSAAELEGYALVHEIVALTDFGRLPVPPWLAQRRDAVVRQLDEAVIWAATAGNVDLAAELLICARLLQAPLTGNYRKAVEVIIAGQLDDGSWGSQTTRRENKRRHAVLTATTALWVYRHAVPA